MTYIYICNISLSICVCVCENHACEDMGDICCISSDEEGGTSAADKVSHQQLTEALDALKHLQLILGICP